MLARLFPGALFAAVFLVTSTVYFVLAAEKAAPTKSNAVEVHHPRNWRFTMPKGDSAKGRAVFEKFECFECHEVRGEKFPQPIQSAPELSQMGPLHPVEFFAESVLDPDAFVPRQYRDSQGRSPMTDFTDKMTVRELIDVSAYLASLSPKGAPKTVSAEGRVIALVPESQEIVVDHGDIKGFMDAMIMGYKVSSPAMLRSLKPGDRVQFVIDTEKRVITKITKPQKAPQEKR